MFGVELFLLAQASVQAVPIADLPENIKQEICLNNWQEAITLTARQIGSSSITPDERWRFIQLRRELEGYRNSRASIDFSNESNCSAVFASSESVEAPVVNESTFDWERGIAAIGQSRNATGSVTSVSSSNSIVASNSSAVSIEFREVQRMREYAYYNPTSISNREATEIYGFSQVAIGQITNRTNAPMLLQAIFYEDVQRVAGRTEVIGAYSRPVGIYNTVDSSILQPNQSTDFALFFNGDFVRVNSVLTDDANYELRQTYPNYR